MLTFNGSPPFLDSNFFASLVAGSTHTFHTHTLLHQEQHDLHNDEQPAKYPLEVFDRHPLGRCDVRSVTELNMTKEMLTWGLFCRSLALPADDGLLQNTGVHLGCTENCNNYNKAVVRHPHTRIPCMEELTCPIVGEHWQLHRIQS